MTATPQALEAPEEAAVIPLEDDEVPTVTCHLRPGYYIKQGKYLITGPKRLRLDVDTAKEHVHMFSNCGAIRKKLAIPTPLRFDPKKRDELMQKRMMEGPAFDRAVRDGVQRQMSEILPGVIAEGVNTVLEEVRKGNGSAPARKKTAKKKSTTRARG